jgi:hypothetical protein
LDDRGGASDAREEIPSRLFFAILNATVFFLFFFYDPSQTQFTGSANMSDFECNRMLKYNIEKIPLSTKSTSADQGTSLKGTWSNKKEIAKEEGMETPPSLVNKE